MENVVKIPLSPMPFDAFNALDVLVTMEIAHISRELKSGDLDHSYASKTRFLERLQAARRVLAASRPPGYRDMIRTQYAIESVCADM